MFEKFYSQSNCEDELGRRMTLKGGEIKLLKMIGPSIWIRGIMTGGLKFSFWFFEFLNF